MRQMSRPYRCRPFSTGPNGYFAYVIGANDTVKRQAVEVAAMQDGLAVIAKG